MHRWAIVVLAFLGLVPLTVAFVACSSSSGSDDADSGHTPGEHDGATPNALYSACAVQGSFGAPCSAAKTGPDTTDCTDPKFPNCFVGGQGSWCTSTCSGDTACTMAAEDGGCAPTSCNSMGYCK